MTKILIIDDDNWYLDVLKDNLELECIPFDICTKKEDIFFKKINEYDGIIVDHSLFWGTGQEEIERLSEYTKSDFAMISTFPGTYSIKELNNQRITGLYGKYQFSNIIDWCQRTIGKKEFYTLAMDLKCHL